MVEVKLSAEAQEFIRKHTDTVTVKPPSNKS